MRVTFGDVEALRTTWNDCVKISNTGFGMFGEEAELVGQRLYDLAQVIAQQESVSVKKLGTLSHKTLLKKVALRRFLLYLGAIIHMDEWDGVGVAHIAFREKEPRERKIKTKRRPTKSPIT